MGPNQKKDCQKPRCCTFRDQSIEDLKEFEKTQPQIIVRRDSSPSPGIADDARREEKERIEDENVEHLEGNDANSPVQPEPRRRNRERRPSTRYPEEEYELIADTGEPQNYREVLSSDQKEEWKKAMPAEMQSLNEKYTYDIVELPKGHRALT